MIKVKKNPNYLEISDIKQWMNMYLNTCKKLLAEYIDSSLVKCWLFTCIVDELLGLLFLFRLSNAESSLLDPLLILVLLEIISEFLL